MTAVKTLFHLHCCAFFKLNSENEGQKYPIQKRIRKGSEKISSSRLSKPI